MGRYLAAQREPAQGDRSERNFRRGKIQVWFVHSFVVPVGLHRYIIGLELIGTVASMVERAPREMVSLYTVGCQDGFQEAVPLRLAHLSCLTLHRTLSFTACFIQCRRKEPITFVIVCRRPGRILFVVFPVGDSLIGGFAAIGAANMAASHIRKK